MSSPLFSFIKFKTAPRVGSVPATGQVQIDFDPDTGTTGAVRRTNPDGTVQYVGAAKTGTPVYGAKATRVLTSTGVAPANGATVTIDGKVYTFQTTLTNVNGNVLIGASAAIALDNLKSAINLTAGSGTTYAALTTLHPTVTATTNTDTQQTIEAKAIGVAANAIGLAETSSVLSWAGATMTGGIDTTPGTKGLALMDNTNIYFALSEITTSSAVAADGWRKIAHSAI